MKKWNLFSFALCVLLLVGCSDKGIVTTSGEEQEVATRSTTEESYFPVKPGSAEWSSFTTHSQMVEACQLSEELLQSLTTDELVRVCAEYPLNMDAYAYSNVHDGMRVVTSLFNGYQELLNRTDNAACLLSYLQETSSSAVQTRSNDMETAKFTLHYNLMRTLLSFDEILQNMDTMAMEEVDALVGLSSIQDEAMQSNNVTQDQAVSTQTIYTPMGSVVPGISEGRNFSNSILETITAEYRETYPNAILLSSYSNSYNCHGYAWHMSEGGNEVWIDETPSIYWTDSSYVETNFNDVEFEKIYYVPKLYSGDHSAIKSPVDGYFISKWGALGLYQHAPLYCPYEDTTQELKYYKLSEQQIRGPKHFCSSGFYAVLPQDGDVSTISWKVVTWDAQNRTGVTTTYTGNTLELKNNGYMSPKCHDITATLNFKTGETKTLTMKATSNEPSPNVGTLYWSSGILSGQVGLRGNSGTIEFTNYGSQNVVLTSYVDGAGNETKNPQVDGVSSLDHDVSYSGSTITLTTTDTPAEGRGELEVYIVSECYQQSEIPFYIPYINIDVNHINMSVNAGQTEMTLSCNSKSRSATGIGRIEITTTDNITVLSQNVNNTTIAQIDISGLSQGTYYVGIVEGEKTYYKKLMID